MLGINGHNTVRDSLQAEQIVGSDDMSPAAIAAEAKKAGLPASTTFPNGRCRRKADQHGRAGAGVFAGYMRIHALESSGGLTYAQMGRYATAYEKPAGTNDMVQAQKGPDGEPVANAARNTWVTETALATALNVSYMAERTALFGIVVGIALLLSGIGFAILAIAGALRNPEPAFGLSFGKRPETPVSTA